jgi:hypothetical protein
MAANVVASVVEACPRTHPFRCPPHQTSGMSALRNAVLHASVDVVDTLLTAGMDPNEEVGTIRTPCMCEYSCPCDFDHRCPVVSLDPPLYT